MTQRPRIHLLDTLRGLCICVMIVYHALWNLRYLFGFDLPWFSGSVTHLVQRIAASTFIALAGFCWSLGRNPLKRGLQVFGVGCLVSAVTLLVMPYNAVIWGVLTLIGGSMLALCLLHPLIKHLNPWAGLWICLFLWEGFEHLPQGLVSLGPWWQWTVPQGFYANYITAFFGFPFPSFSSTDYFPFLPWFPMFLGGYFLSRMNLNLPTTTPSPYTAPLRFMGRHSLLIYVLHQPVIYGLMLAIFGLWYVLI